MKEAELIGPLPDLGPVVIAVDAEGGDAYIKRRELDSHAPDSNTHIVTRGIVGALEDEESLKCVLYGNKHRIERTLSQGISEPYFRFFSKTRAITDGVLARIKIIHVDDSDNIPQGTIIEARKYKSHDKSSMSQAIASVGDTTDSVLSAGNTGSYATISVFKFKKRKDSSISLSIVAPNKGNGRGEVLLLDVGLDDWGDNPNLENVAKKMLADALEATRYLESARGVKSPKIGILNVGRERTKGRVIERMAFDLLEDHPEINFIGFVEGDEITTRDCDAIVTDGDSGNKILKTGEGMSNGILGDFSDVFKKTGLRGKMAQLLLRRELLNLKKIYNPNKNPLGQINGLKQIAGKNHGGCDEEGFTNGLLQLRDITLIDREKKHRIKAQKAFEDQASAYENTED